MIDRLIWLNALYERRPSAPLLAQIQGWYERYEKEQGERE